MQEEKAVPHKSQINQAPAKALQVLSWSLLTSSGNDSGLLKDINGFSFLKNGC